MARSSLRSRVSRRNGTESSGKRLLRVEHLEPRLVLSTTSPLQQLVGGSLAGGSALTVNASADAYVNSSAPVTNYGAAADLLTQVNSNRNFSSASVTFLKFDLSSASSFTKAVLNLTALSKSASLSSVTISVQLLADSKDGWLEGTGGTNRSSSGAITWANAWNGTGLTVTISGSQLKNSNSLAIDVTKLIQQSFNANGIASFVVKVTPTFNAKSASVDFASRENATVSYRPTLTLTMAGDAPTVAKQPAITSQTNTAVSLSVLGADADGDESSLTYTWSVTSPAGATAPTFSSNGSNGSKNTTITFSKAGTYVFTAKITDAAGLTVSTNSISVTVTQVLSKISISPSSVTMTTGSSQKLTAQGVDQFGQTMTLAGSVAWTASQGTISSGAGTSAVTYVAPSSATSATITAVSGSFTASASVTVVVANYLGLLDSTLAGLTQSLDADGSISRLDMITILTTIADETDGVVDATDLSDLKTILKNSTTLCIANYVLVLANDVVNGNTANAHYLGTTLGNLAVGSTNAKLDKLINKWFYGTDLPATGGYSYDTATAGTLYGSGTASHTDEKQGDLGDCYLISALGSLADSSQTAVKNMILDNGDGTWTVRFYSNGTADYVTVNSQLPVSSSGTLVFQGYGSSSTSSSNSLWLALIEKAYAQWNETGKTGRDTVANSYASIEGGWMGDVYDQALGYSSSSFNMTNSAKQTLINALTGKKAVTIGTVTNPASSTGLYGNHAYNVISYNSSTGLFTLYNPWGSNQPNQLTWNQLMQNCDGFAVADTASSVAISASKSKTIFSVIAGQTSLQDAAAIAAKSSTGASDASANEQVFTPVAEESFDASFTDGGFHSRGLSKFAGRISQPLATEVFGADFDAGDDILASSKLSSLAVEEWLDAFSVGSGLS